MYNFYQKEDPILDVDGLKYKLTDGYFSGKEAEIIECNTYNSVIKIPDHIELNPKSWTQPTRI